MRSFGFRPARNAGVSSIGETTFHVAVFHRDFDAEPAELTTGLDLHIAEILGAQVARMWIERRQHAVYGRFNQGFVGDVFDVVRPYPLENITEQVKLPIRFRVIVLGRGGECEGNSPR